MTSPGTLSAAEVRRIDALYPGLPGFGDWADVTIPGDLWQQAAAVLGERRDSAPPEALDAVVEEAMRAAAIDTGAIEGLYEVDRGFTVSVAAMASAWVAEITEEKGPDVAALVLAQRRAYDLAMDAATSGTPVSEAWIRRLHEEVCAAQDTYPVRTSQGPQLHVLPKGAYKRHPNHVLKADGTVRAFAPADRTPAEMHALVDILHSDQFIASHPVIQAAYAHYALAAVHPFADGNGRVARVLASVYLLRATSLPFVVWADQKATYLDALAAADDGHPQRFVDFILSQAVDLQRDVADRLSIAGVPPVDASVERIRRAMMSEGGLSHAEVELAAKRLLQELRDTVQSQLRQVTWPPEIRFQTFGSSSGGEPVEDFRPTQPPEVWGFSIASAAPVQVTVQTRLHVLIATRLDAPFAFRIRRIGHSDGLDLRLGEVHPVLNASARRRIAMWADRVIRVTVADVAAEVERSRLP